MTIYIPIHFLELIEWHTINHDHHELTQAAKEIKTTHCNTTAVTDEPFQKGVVGEGRRDRKKEEKEASEKSA